MSKQTMVQHTPLPWHIGKSNPHVVYGADMTSINQCRTNEDAAFIVRAVNNHDALVNALRGLLHRHPVSVRYYELLTRPLNSEETADYNALKAAEAALREARSPSPSNPV